ncbi:MAG: oligoendopeptidase F [Chloroflexota bacterium]
MSEALKVPARHEIPVEYTWDLASIYPDDARWREDTAALEARLPEVAALQGTLGQGPASLLRVLQLRDEVNCRLDQLRVYASMRRDSDSTEPAGQALTEVAGSLQARVQSALAFIEPEILALSNETITAWLEQDKGLKVYEYYLRDLIRQRDHVRSGEVESILAQFSDVTRAPAEIYLILTNADLAFPTIEDEQGQTVTLSPGRYRRFSESPDRRVRRDNFQQFHRAFGAIRNTLGTTLAAGVRTRVVNARVRRYRSALEAALHPNDIPLEVYHNLIAAIEQSLPRLHRYFRLRQRILALDELHLYDLYAPLVPEVNPEVPFDEARRTLLETFAVLGPEYLSALELAFRRRWIDVYENVGKRSGAYSGGSYTTAPFVLLNYQGRLDDLFTLAHELGHSMHAFFTRRTQPYIYGGHTAFVAEVASTLNEVLLTDYLLRTRPDPALRKHLVVQQLEDIRTVIFRQTMFATYELQVHKAVEAGEPLTAESLSRTYFDLVTGYHGPGVVIDDDIAIEWARIPHFYFNFYVYQYATGLSASLALGRQILEQGQPAVERYLRFLESGASAPSIELLRRAGVDMTTPEPIRQAMLTMDGLLDTLEAMS